jgi:hypothetical protein
MKKYVIGRSHSVYKAQRTLAQDYPTSNPIFFHYAWDNNNDNEYIVRKNND